jgi:hypothetical protein
LFVCCECCVLSGRGLCDELITRPEESYRLWCVVVCDVETSRMRRPWPALGRSATKKKALEKWTYAPAVVNDQTAVSRVPWQASCLPVNETFIDPCLTKI